MAKLYNNAKYFKNSSIAVLEQKRRCGGDNLHSHIFHELVIVASGTAVHHIAGREHKISAGDVFVINPTIEHGYVDFADCCYYDVLYNNENLNIERDDLRDIPGYDLFFVKEPQIRMEQGIPPTLKLNPYELKISTDLAKKIATELKEERSGFAYSSTALLMSLIVHISRCYEEGGCKNENLIQAINYIKENLSNQISLDHLAAISNMSRTNFIRKFREFMNCSPMYYVIFCRIHQAKQMLTSDAGNISEIALACGFNDSNYFSRCFRQHTNMSPREFVKNNTGRTYR